MRKYLAFFRLRLIGSLQYRTAAIAGMCTQFAWGFFELLAFSAFYRSNPAAFPMEFSEVVTYIWLQQALLSLLMIWFLENEVFQAIMSGSIAYQLARPMDLYKRWFCQTAANRLSKAILRFPPVLLVAFLTPAPFRLLPPANGLRFVAFLVSLALALGVIVSFAMLIYAFTFFTLSPTGVRIIAVMLADFLAGGIIPLPFFPPGFREIAEFLPFAAMQNMPLRIYSGNIGGGEALRGLALQFFWLGALVLVGRFLFRIALKKVVVQGG